MRSMDDRKTKDAALLETLAATPCSGAVTIGASPHGPSRPPAGPSISTERYEARSLLGRGGMGEVHLGLDRRIGREVAIKRLPDADAAMPDRRARFLHEARIQGVLEHPSIVPVHDIDVDSLGAPYFTMKRVRGQTLESIVQALAEADAAAAARFGRHKLLASFAQACLAIDFAHSLGVLHRDLKPSNVMLGDFGEVYVLDWGLAKRMDEADAEAGETTESLETAAMVEGTPQTVAGTLMGTPGYMSPEQARGAPLDARSDVYALGLVLFELLALEPLHPGRTPQERLLSALRPSASRAQSKLQDRDVAPELADTVLRATTLEPEERIASARELSEAIEGFLAGDRDVALRKRLAGEHAAAAAADAREALAAKEGANDARRRAIRSVSRALALDPDHPTAMSTLVSLLVEPPAKLPDEVRAELDDLATEQNKIGGRNGAFAFTAIAALVLVQCLVMGVLSWPMLGAMVALSLAAGAASFAFWRMQRPAPRHSMIVLVLSTAAFAATSTIFSPFVLLPTMLATNALVFTVSNERRYRYLIVLVSILGFAIPVALEALGALAPSLAFRGGSVQLLPRAVEFDRTSMMAMLVASTVLSMIVGHQMLGPFRDQLDDAQRRVRTLAWQLRQLVPDGKR